jgi:hypothetical protein
MAYPKTTAKRRRELESIRKLLAKSRLNPGILTAKGLSWREPGRDNEVVFLQT